MKFMILVVALATLVLNGCDSSTDEVQPISGVEETEREESQPSVGKAISFERKEEKSFAKEIAAAETLAESYLHAVNAKDKDSLVKLFYWGGVEDRKSTDLHIRMLLRREVLSVAVTELSESFKKLSMRGFETKGKRYVPNLEVELVLTPKTAAGDGQLSIGRKNDEWFIVAYVPDKEGE